jgi:death-on-curing protein
VYNHPYRDGNKRVGFLSMVVFLGLNGSELRAEEEDVVSTMFALAAGRLSEAELARWLRGNIVPAQPE